MTTSLEWNEDTDYNDPRNDATVMEASNDWVQYAIDKPMAADPGVIFNYSGGASALLTHIFRKETKQNIESYVAAQLFAPLGIRYYWKRTSVGIADTEGGAISCWCRSSKDRLPISLRWIMVR
jgi:CubicO group peptidase (beta-lactamase class C family)